MIVTDRLLGLFVEVADTLTDDFDVIEFLQSLTEHTASVIRGASVGLLLADQHAQLQPVAASNDGSRYVDLLQLQNAPGPCLECFHSGRPVIISDLDTAVDRWPAFVQLAAKSGLHSVHAFPMRLRDHVIGALNVFGSEHLPFDSDDVKVVQALADVATIAIIQERAITAAETLTEQLQGALNSRIVIEQAKGVIARTHRVPVEEAFVLLRTRARRDQLRLTDLALDIVTGNYDPATLTAKK